MKMPAIQIYENDSQMEQNGYFVIDTQVDIAMMRKAHQVALNSPDNATKVGVLIVDHKTNEILAKGYNDMPERCHSANLPWGKNNSNILENKTLYVCHAEPNAIFDLCRKYNLNRISGFKAYVTLFPCNNCAISLIQAGVKEVIYASDEKADRDYTKASKILFEAANVPFRQVKIN